jgi:hypothetical protein
MECLNSTKLSIGDSGSRKQKAMDFGGMWVVETNWRIDVMARVHVNAWAEGNREI